MKKPIHILTLEHSGADEIKCYDEKGEVVAVLTEADTLPAMKCADLDPSNNDDLFTYANHVLGGRFAGYVYQLAAV